MSVTASPLGELRTLDSFELFINDGPNFDVLRKDIFGQRIYHFDAARPDPRILDGGANIGVSTLYFKAIYPAARVTAFEPDPAILPLLRENLARNAMQDVEIVPAALGEQVGAAPFAADGKYGGHLAAGDDATTHVPCVRLRDYLAQPVDFLKLNIEGAEWDVLRDAADRLPAVREMVIEYHHLPGLPRTLHHILATLDRAGFDYLLNDFDEITNPAVRPPFRLTPRTRYFLLVYAKRREL